MLRLIISILVALIVSSCASRPAVVLPKPTVRSIAIVPATDPAEYSFTNVSALQFLVPLAATANHFDSKDKAKLFNERLRSLDMKLAATLTESTAADLRARGYQVLILDQVQRPKDAPDNIDYEKIATTADAILHVSFSEVGMHSPRSSTDYLPRMNVSGVLFVKGRSDYLYDESIYYGVDAKEGKSWAVNGDRAFAYPSFDAVMSSIAEIQRQFENAALKVSERMTAQVHEAIK